MRRGSGRRFRRWKGGIARSGYLPPPGGPNNFCRPSARKEIIAPERACKPGPVTWGMPRETVISLRRRLPGASSGLTRERHAGRASPDRETGIALLFGLAPSGVYRAGVVTHAAGELLPHRFTLTAPFPRRRFAFCGTGPWGCPPWPLASTLPCGARTFLPRELPHAGDHPAFSGANQRAWGREAKYSTCEDHPSPWPSPLRGEGTR